MKFGIYGIYEKVGNRFNYLGDSLEDIYKANIEDEEFGGIEVELVINKKRISSPYFFRTNDIKRVKRFIEKLINLGESEIIDYYNETVNPIKVARDDLPKYFEVMTKEDIFDLGIYLGENSNLSYDTYCINGEIVNYSKNIYNDVEFMVSYFHDVKNKIKEDLY